jgi:RHS repeat-associated protein
VRTFAGRGSYPLVMNYEWDTLGRMTSMTYPAQYGAGDIRKKVEYTYDSASRMESLKFGGVTFASNPVYNAADQMTSLKVGSQTVENYGYDLKTGLLTTQQVVRGGTEKLVDLKYNYTLDNDANNDGAKTGQLTGITDLKNPARNRAQLYDNLGRLKMIKGGINAFTSPDWSQSYTYDGYGNKLGVTKTGNAPQIPVDGMGSVSVNPVSNRITSAGFAYNNVGDQTRAMIDESGVQQQYKYDAARRLVEVRDGSGTTVVASYSYGEGSQRLMSVAGGVTRYYCWGGEEILSEYEAVGASGLQWKTSYVYLGGQLMATTSGSNGSETRFHHPYRLSGTRLVTDAANGDVVTEQLGLPYGTMQPYGAYGGDNSYQHATKSNPSRKRFTSYDHDSETGQDYAINRYYSSRQGRFTQVDPIEMGSVNLANPQSLNLYSYVEGDPVNRTDPLGLQSQSQNAPTPNLIYIGPYPTGGGGGGGWWNNGLVFGPFSISFGTNSGFAHPFILLVPLPQNRILLMQQLKELQKINYPQLPQQPVAQGFLADLAEGAGKEFANQLIDFHNLVIFGSRGPAELYKEHYKPDNDTQDFAMAMTMVTTMVIGPGELKGLLSGVRLARMGPYEIRFSQPTVSRFFSDGNTIQSTMMELRAGKPVTDLPVIRVADYKGQVFTLDNRRLLAFQSAGVDSIPVQFVSLKDPKIAEEFFNKLNPINGGLMIVITNSTKKGRAPAERLLRKHGKIK